MHLREIVNREPSSLFTVEELSFVVESYIHQRKGVVVVIDLLSNYSEEIIKLMPNDILVSIYATEVTKLQKAFDIARKWYLEN